MNETETSETDWARQMVDSLDGFVSGIRAKTTEPIQKAAKYAVFALMALGVIFMMLLLLTISVIRLLDWVLPVWGAYLVLGGIFVVAGLLAWSRRHVRS